MMHHYALYGLHVVSTFVCPELWPAAAGAPDVIVREGVISGGEHDSVVARQEQDGAFLLAIPGVAHFRVVGGEEIVIARAPGSEDAAVRLFLLGSAFGALLHQRGIVPIHGSAVATTHGALIFSGPQGHGKSTLAAAFVQRGYPLLSDDVCALTLENGMVWLHPAYPRLNLLPDALERLSFSKIESSAAIPFSGKYPVAPTTFLAQTVPLLAIYELHPTASETIRFSPLQGYARLTALMGNTYRVQFLHEMGKTKHHFVALNAMAQQVRVVRVERPSAAYWLDQLATMIAEDIALLSPNGDVPWHNP